MHGNVVDLATEDLQTTLTAVLRWAAERGVERADGLLLRRNLLMLLTGELSDVEILAGSAVPAVAIAWLQIALYRAQLRR
ncbi:hypothetical protein [Kribbella flavida]|uniref:hypothetical protein n=1 Tax=Kribbella flavida TaxID=182640 RepID=UPI0011D23C82|nr:hypothetical protein [Kribbella flavida]